MYALVFALSTLLVASSCVQAENEKTIKVEVCNDWTKSKTDEPVVIKLQDLHLNFQVKSATVWEGDNEIPSQLDDLNNDLKADEVVFLTDVVAGGKKEFKIVLSATKSDVKKEYPTRVYAELLVSDKRGKHVPVQAVTIPGTSNIYNQMHHHGPAMESELVAYRVYFDQKQTIDPYGKFNKGFEIQESQFYPTDEQLARGFGDDVLLVGGSAGLGAFKGWNGKKATHIEPVLNRTSRMIAYGPIRAIAESAVTEWNYQNDELNMINRYILYGGHRDLRIETYFDQPLKEKVFATGVINIVNSEHSSDGEGLVGCWGTHWPVNDTIKYAKETVGLAAYIPKKYVGEEVKDKVNYLYTMKADGEQSLYHYTNFTSMKETFGYKTPEAWFAYIREWKEELEHPVRVTIK